MPWLDLAQAEREDFAALLESLPAGQREARQYARPRGLTAGFGGMVALTDNMIHQQDIRRALDIWRTIPADRLRTALDFASWRRPSAARVGRRGVHLVATDLDWSHGGGPAVCGTGQALLMAIAGRNDALKDLSGSGQARLAQRI